MNKKRVCVVTSTRAEYGLLHNIIKLIDSDPDLECLLVVTGSHLLTEFGNTVREIESDGVRINERIDIQMAGDSGLSMGKTMGIAMILFSEYFSRSRPDVLVLLGDRYEIHAVACAATCLKIPIAHLHGGETTEGALDEIFRHSITKMSYLHFTSTEKYRERVIQLGESPERVFNVGSTGVENINKTTLLTREELCASIGINLRECYAVGTFHPVTMANSSVEDMIQIMEACASFKEIDFLFTKSNADAGGKQLNEILKKYVEKCDNIFLVDSLGYLKYMTALKYAAFIIGNSSSGIVEAPEFHIATVNIGDRQKGRIQAKSVINAAPTQSDIREAVEKARKLDCSNVNNPYKGRNTSVRVVETIKRFLREDNFKSEKPFFDLNRDLGER